MNGMQTAATFRRWITDQIENLAPGSRLPPDRELAGQWDMSARTIRRVLHRLYEEGSLVRIPGKGTFIPGGTDHAQQIHLSAAKDATARLAEALKGMIAAGELRQNTQLPLAKFFCRSLHVSEKTVTAALRQLQSRGDIHRIGRKYMVGAPRLAQYHKSRRTVVLLTPERSDFHSVFTSDMLAPAYRAFERELNRYGYAIQMAADDDLDGMLRQ